MTTMDFMNDYYFLEEATRFTKEIKCNPTVRSNNRLNLRFIKLRKEAQSRNVKLYFLNNGLSKRKRNQSVYKGQEQAIYWFIEFIFPNASNYVILRKFSENTKVHEIIETILDYDGDEQRSKQLEFYKAEGANKLRVFLKAEGLKNSQNRYHEMNPRKSLRSNLRGKVIIEYPTLFVVINHSADGFNLVPSDGESQNSQNLLKFLTCFSFLDKDIENEMKNFKKTLHEEVFGKKIGQNPPLLVNPEEVPIISEVLDEPGKASSENFTKVFTKPALTKSEIHSDDEVKPENYLFSNDSW